MLRQACSRSMNMWSVLGLSTHALPPIPSPPLRLTEATNFISCSSFPAPLALKFGIGGGSLVVTLCDVTCLRPRSCITPDTYPHERVGLHLAQFVNNGRDAEEAKNWTQGYSSGILYFCRCSIRTRSFKLLWLKLFPRYTMITLWKHLLLTMKQCKRCTPLYHLRNLRHLGIRVKTLDPSSRIYSPTPQDPLHQPYG